MQESSKDESPSDEANQTVSIKSSQTVMVVTILNNSSNLFNKTSTLFVG